MKAPFLFALMLISGAAFSQEEEDPADDINHVLIDINESNPLPISHDAIEQSTQENEEVIHGGDSEGSGSEDSEDDPDFYAVLRERNQ